MVKFLRMKLGIDHFSAKQGFEGDPVNILCMGGRTVDPEVTWDLVRTYVEAAYSSEPRHLRRLGKVREIERCSFHEFCESYR